MASFQITHLEVALSPTTLSLTKNTWQRRWVFSRRALAPGEAPLQVILILAELHGHEAVFTRVAAEHLYETPLSGDQKISEWDADRVQITASVQDTGASPTSPDSHFSHSTGSASAHQVGHVLSQRERRSKSGRLDAV